MRCAATESMLIDYYFALATAEQRQVVHAHLRDCRSCMHLYLDLKQAVDGGAELGVRPSAKARARLRAEVAAMFQPTRIQRTRQWLGRPVPRYQVAAAMASGLFLVLIVAVLGLRGQVGTGGPVLAHRQDGVELGPRARPNRALRHGYEAVDTARPMAVSLTYY